MLKNSFSVMVFTSISRVLGLIRTLLIAYYFGAGMKTDAYFSSYKIANFFRQLFGEGALGAALIPTYNEKENAMGKDEAKVLIFSVLNFLFIFLVILSLVTIFFSTEIIEYTVKGYSIETKLLAIKLLRIMSFYILFIGISGTISVLLNNFNSFKTPAFMPIMFNISIISSILFFHKKYGIIALAYGVLIGGILELMVVLPIFCSKIKNYKIKIEFKDPCFKKIFKLMAPMLLGIFARQINTIIDQFFASYLVKGSVTALENATRIYGLPLGIFAISITNVLFPVLSKNMEKNDYKGAKFEMEKSLNFVSFLIIPSIFILTFYSRDVVKLLLGYGEFSKNEIINLTSESLFYYSIGLLFYSWIHIISRGFYSKKNTKRPVAYSIISISINITLNYLLVGIMQHRGLALSTSIASMFNFILLYVSFNKRYIKLDTKKISKFILKTSIVSFIALFFTYKIKIIILKLIAFLFVYFIFFLRKIMKEKVNFFTNL